MTGSKRRGELEASQQTVRFLETVLRASVDGVVITDASQNIVLVNETFCEFLAARRGDVIETDLYTWLERVGSEVPARWADLEERVQADGACRDFEFTFGAGAELRYLSVNASLVGGADEGEPGIIISVWRDVTEIKRVEKEQLRAIADYSYDWESWLAPDGTLKWVNPAVERLTGYSVAECHAMVDYPLPIVLDTHRAQLGEQLRQALANRSSIDDLDFLVSRKDGAVRWMAVSGQAIYDDRNVYLGYRTSMRDITERQRAEADKAKLEEQLRHSQKMEAIGLLSGGVAHDFNNLLCVIMSNAEMATLDLGESDPVRESLDMIIGASERAAALTRQLLAFSRKQVIEPKVINLSELIESLHSILVRLIGEDVILRSVPQGGLGSVHVDPGQIEQIVLNLAVNARDAMPDGGELLIETTNVVLDDDYCSAHLNAAPGTHVMLAVSDTGCGMSAEVRERIFEPFFTTKQMGRGTGLGLATVFGIVEQSGGRIEVYSEPGEGSCFKVYFPRHGAQAEKLTRVRSPLPLGGRETLLVVEDDESVRTITVKILRSHGYHVLAASSGADALALAERHRGLIDLLLTDVIMPHMNGRQLAVRLVEQRPGIKVLFTSGYTDNAIVHHGVLDPGVQFLAKPFTPNVLSARVREVLSGNGER
jgi:two-component system, cell cycle sensor histidine kinase and response regulator CckA